MNPLQLAARPLLVAQLCLRIAGTLAVVATLFMCGLARAQDAASPAAATAPAWLTILVAVLPFLITALVALHPLLKLADFLHARALDANRNAMAKLALLGGESLSKSLDHFLEVSQQDAKDLVDPAKRAMALTHMQAEAKSEAMPALSAAAGALGANWVTGTASQVIDAAIAKAPSVTPAQKLGDGSP